MAKLNPGAPNFLPTWDDLAQALGVTRRAIQEWRRDPRYAADCPRDRADGRKDVLAWREFMRRHGLKRADEDLPAEDLPAERKTVAEWKEYREQLECTRIERSIAKDDGGLLVAAELEIAFGQLLAGIQTALSMLPSTASRFLVGLRDVHEVQSRLQGEVDAVITQLNLALYLDDALAESVAAAADDPQASNLCGRLLFDGADREILLDLAATIAKSALAIIGRRAIAQLTHKAENTQAAVLDDVTGQVTEIAQEKASAERQADNPDPAPKPPRTPPKRKPRPKRKTKHKAPRTNNKSPR